MMDFCGDCNSRLVRYGCILCVVGVIFALSLPPTVTYFRDKELSLNPRTKGFKNWETPPVPMHMDFYLFNWTNPENIMTEKPNFIEMGPYRYNERRKKVNITRNANGTLSYRLLRFWHFNEDESNGRESDLVTSLNGVAVAGARRVRNKGYIQQKAISWAFGATDQKISVTHSVRDMLFDGYSDPLITIGRSVGASSSPYDRFGWFYGRNGSYKTDGFFNIDSGARGREGIGALRNWNYRNNTRFYPGSCGNIYGSSGDLYPPGRTRDDTISLFSNDICRSLTLKYSRDAEVEGIPVLRYDLDPLMLDNGTVVPENKCFCNGQCIPSGLLNLTQCRYGVPAFISLPHFLHADQYYREQVNGMKPHPEKHIFYMSVEPTTGFPLEAAARIQVNLLLQPAQYITLFENVPTIYIPVLWVQHRFKLTSNLATELRLAVLLPSMCYAFSGVIFIIGLTLIFIHIAYKKNEEQDKSIVKVNLHGVQTKSPDTKEVVVQ